MNTKTILSMNALIAVVAIASIVMISGVTEAPMVVADEEKAQGLYKMADSTQVVATFDFRDGVETVSIPVFNQETDLTDVNRPTFTFQKIVGDTPLLHKATDVFQKFMGRDPGYPHHFNDFETIVDIYHGGKHVRSFEYADCKINSYMIGTQFDKEEGYYGKTGFAIVEDYEVECTGYTPHAIDFETMIEEEYTNHKTTTTISSLDLLEQKSVWNGQLGNDASVDDVEKSPSKMNSLARMGESATHSEYRN